MLDVEDGQAGLVDGEVVEGLRGVGDDAERARGDSLVDVAIAVGRAAFHGDEDGAGAHAARVVFDAGDGRGGAAGGADGSDFSDEIVPDHAVLIVDTVGRPRLQIIYFETPGPRVCEELVSLFCQHLLKLGDIWR